MSYQHLTIGFRLLALAPEAVRELRALLAIDVESRPSRCREDALIVAFDLHEGGYYGWLKTFLERWRVPEHEYGLFISVATSSDSEIIRLPPMAKALFREIGGEIDFSFTVLAEE